MSVEAIAQNLGLGALLSDLRSNFGGYEILDHWQRGEFHHDLLLRVEPKDPASWFRSRRGHELQWRREGGLVPRVPASRGRALALSLPGVP